MFYINQQAEVTLTVVSEKELRIQEGELVQGQCVFHKQGKQVTFLTGARHRGTPVMLNPYFYKGEFFSSRLKQDGNISLHGLIRQGMDLEQAHEQARRELEVFFMKLALTRQLAEEETARHAF